MTATTVRTTGKDNDDSKDNNSKDDGDDGKDDNNDGGTDDRGGGGNGGGKIGGEVSGVARSVAVAWLVAVFFAVGCLALTYRRNRTDMFGNKFIILYLFVYHFTGEISFRYCDNSCPRMSVHSKKITYQFCSRVNM
jgi:hypothetical protein